MPRFFPGGPAALLVLLLAWTPPASFAAKGLQIPVTANHYQAMKEFLLVEGYWEDETRAVLDPLEGELSLDSGTPDCHLIQTMDDIPGLRPLPEGLIEFLHNNHNVFYLAVGDDRLLVGIAREAKGGRGPAGSPTYRFTSFDLIEGRAASPASSEGGNRQLTAFLYAHDSYLGQVLTLIVLGVALLGFLAVRLRRRARPLAGTADPVIAAWRLRAETQIFRVAAAAWLALLAAVYALMHFAARLSFMEMAAGADQVSFEMAETLGFLPDRLRVTSFALVMAVALLTSLVLGLWSGAVGRGGRTPEGGR